MSGNGDRNGRIWSGIDSHLKAGGSRFQITGSIVVCRVSGVCVWWCGGVVVCGHPLFMIFVDQIRVSARKRGKRGHPLFMIFVGQIRVSAGKGE